MAVRRLSPTANLLRNSRLFSLPPPLIKPSDKTNNSQRYGSETATLPYPTQQAIETTPSSLARGDWGLKRSLPLKSTARTSTPTIRIGDIDSIDHITEFESAADHVLNLKKWEEIGLPVTIHEDKRHVYNIVDRDQPLRVHRSVFESQYDNTEGRSDDPKYKRWKHRGPWLAGQTAGEFNEYTEKEIRARKTEFRDFLRERLASKIATEDRRAAIDGGLDLPGEPPEVTEEQLNHHIKELRQDQQGLLFRYIEEFLDLPSGTKDSDSEVAWTSSEGEKGPPTTHPSAGLSYLRTPSHTFNHPGLGPQAEERPVRARILGARDDKAPSPVVGVAGVAVEDPRIQGIKSTRSDRPPPKGVTVFDQEIPGGAKMWIQPDRISVDSQGRINVRAKEADPKTTALYVLPEKEDEHPDPVRSAPRLVPDLIKKTNTGANYNYGVNDQASSTSRPPRRSDRPLPYSQMNPMAGLLDLLKKE